jgi:hypothetical protein
MAFDAFGILTLNFFGGLDFPLLNENIKDLLVASQVELRLNPIGLYTPN